VIYSYTGDYFNEFYDNNPSDGPTYDASMRVTVTLELESPFPADPTGPGCCHIWVDPISYTISDGVNIVTEATNPVFKLFGFTVDANAAITDWLIQVQTRDSSSMEDYSNIVTVNSLAANQALDIGGTYIYTGSPSAYAKVSDAPGTWTCTGLACLHQSPSPQPSTSSAPVSSGWLGWREGRRLDQLRRRPRGRRFCLSLPRQPVLRHLPVVREELLERAESS